MQPAYEEDISSKEPYFDVDLIPSSTEESDCKHLLPSK